MSGKFWAAGDACTRAVNIALLVKKGETGMPSVLTTKTWGFYDILFKSKPFKFQCTYGSYIMENVIFKISFPAEFHAPEDAARLSSILSSDQANEEDFVDLRGPKPQSKDTLTHVFTDQ
jgi:2-methylcitrate dehydratase PrpD